MCRSSYTIACQTALDAVDYERVKRQARRVNMTIREWVREQVMFGLEAYEEEESEAKKVPAPPKDPPAP